ncbi:MAG TPA: phosphopyruvate hydratase [Candidatus Paceibacterota bacterium]
MIEQLTARSILDSRGEWTIEVALTALGHRAVASVPQGESRGEHEAVAVLAETAVENVIEIIAPVVRGLELGKQIEFDEKIRSLDGTTNKSHLGGNALLATSIVYARLSALVMGVPLWRYLRQLSQLEGKPTRPPRLLSLMIEGGLHADGGSPFQEYLVLPKVETIAEAVATVTKLYGTVREIVRERFGPTATHLGDEGAFALPLTNPLTPFALIMEAIEDAGLVGKFDVGLDVAADNVSLSPEELIVLYDQMRADYSVCYLEDPFNENDLDHFAALLIKWEGGVAIVGDDLTVTNVGRMELAKVKKSINAMIVKPNQIGTVSETLEAVARAREYGWKIFVSHRGRETNDDFIADLAWGVGADGIKLGAPARGERVAKYNRLLEIETRENTD